MIKKVYVVTGINDHDWKEIFSCLRFASMFSDKSIKKHDLTILKNIIIRDLEQDMDLKNEIKKWLWKGD